ncbi:MAG: glycine C-acetyltransferase [Nitrospinota bacterium]
MEQIEGDEKVSKGLEVFAGALKDIKESGLFKAERIIMSPQGEKIALLDGLSLNFCSNNYLGLANDPAVLGAAHAALDRWGFGLSSVRFICGTQDIHKELESKISKFLGTEETILYSSCFDANAGLFETALGAQDAVISDSLNHASIIDGVRLCKAKRLIYTHADMEELEKRLKETRGCRIRMIATDGVFSMDGTIANLSAICDLADKYDALVMVDDSHSVGVLGKTGRGTHEYHNVLGRVDVITGTLGKALGGASGGYTSGRQEVISLLRQRSRPYLFSNTLAPVIAATSIAVLNRLAESTELRNRLHDNAKHFRARMTESGFNIQGGKHPIIPIMLGDARLATTMADRLLEKGVYVTGFSFPVVPKGTARIRVQISSAHSKDDLDYAVAKFIAVKKEL